METLKSNENIRTSDHVISLIFASETKEETQEQTSERPFLQLCKATYVFLHRLERYSIFKYTTTDAVIPKKVKKMHNDEVMRRLLAIAIHHLTSALKASLG